MSANAPALSRADMEALIVKRAWKDPAFKKEFVANPIGTIEKYAGQKLPGNLKLIVHEEDENTMHMSIPVAPAKMNELSDADLEKVAGGEIVVAVTTAIMSAVLSVTTAVSQSQTERRFGW